MNIGFIVFLSLLFLLVFNLVYVNHIKETSYLLNQAKITNQQWIISQVKRKHRVANYYSNKNTYYNANIGALTKAHFKVNIPYYEQQIHWAKTNLTKFPGYTKSFDALLKDQHDKPSRKLNGKRVYFLYKFYERIMLKTSRIKPVMSLTMHSFAQYTSAKGRVSEKKWLDYPFESIIQLLQEAKQELAYEQSRIGQMKKERGRLSASLRYEILKRDHFMCKLCGRTKSDGVKLHVDHIFPIAKGGKTEPHNLRVLCDECNLGKKDKVEILKSKP